VTSQSGLGYRRPRLPDRLDEWLDDVIRSGGVLEVRPANDVATVEPASGRTIAKQRVIRRFPVGCPPRNPFASPFYVSFMAKGGSAMRTTNVWSLIVAGLLLSSSAAVAAEVDGSPKNAGAKGAARTVVEAGASKQTAGALVRNAVVEGALREGQPTFPDRSFYEAWTFQGEAGERVRLSMESNAFDPYVVAYGPDGGLVDENDDGPDGTNSMFELALSATGEYTVRATSYEGGETGLYRLMVEGLGRIEAPEPLVIHTDGPPAERYALIVAIADYPGSASDLPPVAGDRRAIERLLREQHGFDEDRILVLADEMATRTNVVDALLKHLGQAGAGGTALFYYSGHGTQVEGNLALAADLDPEPDGVDEALALYDGLLLDDEVGYLLSRLQADSVLVVFDSCFSGTGTRGELQPKRIDPEGFALPSEFVVGRPADDGEKTRAARNGDRAELLGDPDDHVLLAGSAEDQYSYTAPELAMSAFTHFLVGALQASADDLDVTLRALMEQVSRRTANYVLDAQGAAQTPEAQGKRVDEPVARFLRK